MLTPEYLATLPDDVVNLWNEFETKMLEDIARRINIADESTPTIEWRINKMMSLGEHQDYISNQLVEMTKKSSKEIHAIMKDAIKSSLSNDLSILDEAKAKGLIADKSLDVAILNPIIEQGYKATNGVIKDFTKTYASALSKTYENAIDLAYLNVSTGYMSQSEAIKYAVESLFNENGLPALVTKNGRIEQIDTVVARAVRTGVNQSVSKMQIANLNDLGCDLVEVSSHYGARPSHAEWQGKIYSLSGKSSKYPNFYSATGYGTGEGLCGWNCRHNFHPYFEGMSTKSFDDIDIKKNNRLYELQQKERRLSRELKKLKKKERVLRAGGVDSLKEKNKLSNYSKEIKKINEELKNQLDLNYVITAGYEDLISDLHKSKEYYDELPSNITFRDKKERNTLESYFKQSYNIGPISIPLGVPELEKLKNADIYIDKDTISYILLKHNREETPMRLHLIKEGLLNYDFIFKNNREGKNGFIIYKMYEEGTSEIVIEYLESKNYILHFLWVKPKEAARKLRVHKGKGLLLYEKQGNI